MEHSQASFVAVAVPPGETPRLYGRPDARRHGSGVQRAKFCFEEISPGPFPIDGEKEFASAPSERSLIGDFTHTGANGLCGLRNESGQRTHPIQEKESGPD